MFHEATQTAMEDAEVEARAKKRLHKQTWMEMFSLVTMNNDLYGLTHCNVSFITLNVPTTFLHNNSM